MRYLFLIILLIGFLITPAFAEELKNPSLIIETIEIPAKEFNTVLRNAPIILFNNIHSISYLI